MGISKFKTAIALSAIMGALGAQEFNEVGHKALGMGGVGVAVKNNPHSMFFNPALISAKPGLKVGYNIGAHLSADKMFDIFDYRLNNISDVPKFNELLKKGVIDVKATGSLALALPHFSDAVGDFAIGYVTSIYAGLAFSGQVPTGISDIDNSDVYVVSQFLNITEVPLVYAHSIDSGIGEFNVGVALKYMSAEIRMNDKLIDRNFTAEKLVELVGENSGAKASSSTFGVDLGLTYSPMELLTFGLVGKNLNTPKFGLGGANIKVNPQARLGAAFNLTDRVTLAMDADLTKNAVYSLAQESLYSQKIGVGIDLDILLFGARAGIAKDLRQDNGAILSFGIGIGFIDVNVAFSSATAKYNGSEIPKYVAFQVGGGFSF